MSHYTVKGRSVDWPLAAERLRPVLDDVLNGTLEAGYFLNVNLPHPEHNRTCLETKRAPVDPSPHRTTFSQTGDGFLYTGIYQERWRQPGSDVDLCFKGHISLSKIAV